MSLFCCKKGQSVVQWMGLRTSPFAQLPIFHFARFQIMTNLFVLTQRMFSYFRFSIKSCVLFGQIFGKLKIFQEFSFRRSTFAISAANIEKITQTKTLVAELLGLCTKNGTMDGVLFGYEIEMR